MELIAHRGYSFVAPENTWAAFQRALEAGAAAIECDLQRTRDGQLIVLHDATLNRTTNGRGSARARTLEQLSGLSFGYPRKFGGQFSEERVLTFQELLHRLRGRAHLYAEIKKDAIGRAGIDFHRDMIRRVRESGLDKQVTFISFDWKAIETVRSLDSNIQVGLLFDHWRPRSLLNLGERLRARILIGRADLVERRGSFATEAHRRGMRLGVYTVDTRDRLQRLDALGVDAAATNRIGEMLRAFSSVKNVSNSARLLTRRRVPC